MPDARRHIHREKAARVVPVGGPIESPDDLLLVDGEELVVEVVVAGGAAAEDVDPLVVDEAMAGDAAEILILGEL